jgi:tripartite-type tricarboxylate transporter receptor subunit TctC
MRKTVWLVLLLSLALVVSGCSGGTSTSGTQQQGSQSGESKEAASAFPEKDLKIIVPFAPGGAVDVTCRFIAQVAPKYMDGKSIIVENVEGGGAVIGQSQAAKSAPDGYTILAYTSSVVTNPITKQTDYTHKSFKPVTMYCYDPEVLVVSTDSQFNTLEEFIEYGKTNKISMGTPGNSTSHHIAGMILEDRTGVQFNYIHNDSAAMQVTQILGGHVQSGLMAYGEAKSQILDGKMKVLGIMDTERNKEIEDVPTFIEKGIDIKYGAWRGLAVPVDTPDDVVEELEKIFEKVLSDPELVESFTKAGYPLVFKGSDEFTQYVDNEAKDLEKMLALLKK